MYKNAWEGTGRGITALQVQWLGQKKNKAQTMSVQGRQASWAIPITNGTTSNKRTCKVGGIVMLNGGTDIIRNNQTSKRNGKGE